MAWRQSGDKPSSEPNMVNLPMHICVTRPQWVNKLPCFFQALHMWGPENKSVEKSKKIKVHVHVWFHLALRPYKSTLIELLHKSHNAPAPYPTMHNFVTEMCTFLLQNGALLGIWWIVGFVRWVYWYSGPIFFLLWHVRIVSANERRLIVIFSVIG